MIYFERTPRELPAPPSVIVHNHVRPVKPLNLNGFRAWTQTQLDNLELCPCPWSGLTHYRVKSVRPYGGRPMLQADLSD
jgi:hypothetical protein